MVKFFLRFSDFLISSFMPKLPCQFSTFTSTYPSPDGTHSWSRKMMVEETVRRRKSGDLRAKIKAEKDRRKSSSSNSMSALRDRAATAGPIEPLVSILHCSRPLAAQEVALLALLNLAARNQRSYPSLAFVFLFYF